ncbi:MAG: hypothetical protein FWE45_02460 [Firmicutes bacterium]|nr:hypothetical protein [Bacillota bacterium]
MKKEINIDEIINIKDWIEPSPLPNANFVEIEQETKPKPKVKPYKAIIKTKPKSQPKRQPETIEQQSTEEKQKNPLPRHSDKQSEKETYSSKSTPPKPTDNGLDLMSLLPLLGNLGGGNNSQMDMMLKMFANKNGSSSPDLMSMLPLLMNSGLFSQKKDSSEPSNKVINLDEYKRIN